jgi:hypothetical protein
VTLIWNAFDTPEDRARKLSAAITETATSAVDWIVGVIDSLGEMPVIDAVTARHWVRGTVLKQLDLAGRPLSSDLTQDIADRAAMLFVTNHCRQPMGRA